MKNQTGTEITALRYINASHSLPNSLPHELLAEIFKFACPPIDFSKRALSEPDEDEEIWDAALKNVGSDTYPTPRGKHDLRYRYLPLILSAVCHRWREAALSSHGLWSTFAMEVIDWKFKSQIPLLRFYLSNSGPLGFSLDLDIRLQQYAYCIGGGAWIEQRELQPLNHYRLLSHLPHVQSLVFRRCITSFVKVIFNLLAHHIHHIPAIAPNNTILLPDLNKVMVQNHQEGEENGIGKLLLGMLEERKPLLEISQFTFEAEDYVVKWSHSATSGGLVDGFSVTAEGMVDAYFPDGTELGC